MAVRQIVVSDIGGAELEDSQVAKVRVSGHPALGQRVVELDVSTDEAKQFEADASEFVYLEVDVPGQGAKEVILGVPAFEKILGTKAEVKSILDAARDTAKQERQTRRRRRTSSSSSNGGGEKLDYTSPEAAGMLHRGRVTETEAEWVRANLDAANKNREKAGQSYIDPNGEADKRRYGL